MLEEKKIGEIRLIRDATETNSQIASTIKCISNETESRPQIKRTNPHCKITQIREFSKWNA